MRRGERERERSQQATYVDWSKDEKDNGGAWVILVTHGLFSCLSTAPWAYSLLNYLLASLLILTGARIENFKGRSWTPAGAERSIYIFADLVRDHLQRLHTHEVLEMINLRFWQALDTNLAPSERKSWEGESRKVRGGRASVQE